MVPSFSVTKSRNLRIIKKQTSYSYDNAYTHNVTALKEWDYISTGSSFGATPTRETDTTYVTSSTYTNKHLISLPTAAVVKNAGTAEAATQFGYDAYSLTATSGALQHDYTNYSTSNTTRGLVTSVTRCTSSLTSVPCTGLTTTMTYDDLGNMLTSTTPGSHTTSVAYSSSNYGAYPTQVTLPSTGVSHVSSTAYDFSTGLVTSTTDENSNTTYFTYDSMLRPYEVTYPDGGYTVNDYYPIATSGTSSAVRHKTKMSTTPTWMTDFVYFDGFGRTVRTAHANDESGTNIWDKRDTCYDSSGRVSFASLPYQGAAGSFPTSVTNPPGSPSGCSGLSGDSYAYSTPSSNKMRVAVTHADSTSNATDVYGRATSYTDEGNGTAATKKIWQVDGLGRTVSTCEVTNTNQEPNSGSYYAPTSCGLDISGTGFLTTSTYDSLNNLTSITQGALSRTFNYDALSRLASAIAPESGTTSYTYDSDSNVYTRVRPAPNQLSSGTTVTSTYSYDALDRLTGASYSDGTTPSVVYGYDSSSFSNPKGRMTSAAVGVAGYSGVWFDYDTMGRVLAESECTPNTSCSTDFPLYYTYDKAGNLVTSSDGFSHTLTNTYNQAGRLVQVASSLTGTNYPSPLISSITYGPFGPLTTSLGNTKTETIGYSSRGFYSSRTVSGSIYSLGSVSFAGNGNLTTATETVNGTATTWSYTYDDFNRLSAASKTGESLTFDYDRYGNRWHHTLVSETGTNGPSLTFNNAYNQIDGYCYDAAGNLLKEASCPGTISAVPYKYDAENRMITPDGGTTFYGYDALGRRVSKQTSYYGSTSSTEYLYDLANRKVVTMTSPSTWTLSEIYASGRHLATYTPSTTYFSHTDWLGTTRARTNPLGTVTLTCTNEPFGSGQSCTGTDAGPDHFTGDDDDDAALRHTQYRQLSVSQGRWFTPDPYGANIDPGNPQSLNRYAYVLNNPINASDPSGLVCIYLNDLGTAVDEEAPEIGEEECQGDGANGGGYWVPGDFALVTYFDPNSNVIGARSTVFGQDVISYANSGGPSGSWTQYTPVAPSNPYPLSNLNLIPPLFPVPNNNGAPATSQPEQTHYLTSQEAADFCREFVDGPNSMGINTLDDVLDNRPDQMSSNEHNDPLPLTQPSAGNTMGAGVGMVGGIQSCRKAMTGHPMHPLHR